MRRTRQKGHVRERAIQEQRQVWPMRWAQGLWNVSLLDERKNGKILLRWFNR